jgi:hypothetical protein
MSVQASLMKSNRILDVEGVAERNKKQAFSQRAYRTMKEYAEYFVVEPVAE